MSLISVLTASGRATSGVTSTVATDGGDSMVIGQESELVRSMRSVIDQLVETNGKLASANERMSGIIAGLQGRVDELTEANQALIRKHAELSSRPKTGDSEAAVSTVRDCYEAFREFSEKDEKAHNLVVLGAPEGVDDDTTAVRDRQLADKMLRACGLSENELLETFRHGVKRGPRPRTLKIKFKRKNTARIVLRTMRENRLFGSLLPSGSRIRKDLNFDEQMRERELRKEAHGLNMVAGELKWRVSDNLELVEVRKPRSWQNVPTSEAKEYGTRCETGSQGTSNVTLRATRGRRMDSNVVESLSSSQ